MDKSSKQQIIAISGVTNGGKTVLANSLKSVIPEVIIFNQDDYFHENHSSSLEVFEAVSGTYNWDTLSSIHMELLYQDVKRCMVETAKETKIIIVEGNLILNYRPLEKLFTSKLYIKLDQEECFKRRLTRIYDPPDVPQYFELCVWPMYLKYLKDVEDNVSNVVFLNGNNTKQEIFDFVINKLNMKPRKEMQV